MRIIYKEAGKEYTSTNSKKNYGYITPDGVFHMVDGAKFAFEVVGNGPVVEVDENEIPCKNGYPQNNGESVVVHGVSDTGILVQYGNTKDSRGYKTISCNTPVLVKIAEAYRMILNA